MGSRLPKTIACRRRFKVLNLLLAQTGAHNVFGVSAGGLIALQAALTLPAVQKTAVYEPAFFIHGVPAELVKRLDQEIEQGKVAAALVTAMKGAQMGPPVFNYVPRGLLEMLTNMAMRGEEKKAKGDDVTMRMFAPTLDYDLQLIAEMTGRLDSFRGVRSEVLLLGGSRSPAYLKEALDALEGILPDATRVEFPGLDHGGSSDISATNRSGNPELVAQELRRFFA